MAHHPRQRRLISQTPLVPLPDPATPFRPSPTRRPKHERPGPHHEAAAPHVSVDRARRGTPPRGKGRTIVASLVADVVAALLLVLVVFPGATEATTTGVVLLTFRFGWALMAFLTVRRTRQPQRWAHVPAAWAPPVPPRRSSTRATRP